MITKPSPPVEQVKHINLRLLKPPPQQAGDIVVHQEPDVQLPAAPPLHIRQKTQDQIQLPPMVIRERPPPTECIPEKHITLPGKILPPPPRQVILERLPSAPPHPQEVTVERWLESEPATRRVVYKPAPPLIPALPEKNLLIQHETPHVFVRNQFNFLGVQPANPHAYATTYGREVVDASHIPPVPTPNGVRLAAESPYRKVPVLTGDVGALRGLNLNCYGLGEYDNQVNRRPSSSYGCLNMNTGPWQRCECPNCCLFDSSNGCVSSEGKYTYLINYRPLFIR